MLPLRNVTKQLCNESLIHSQMEIDFEVTEYLRAPPPEIYFKYLFIYFLIFEIILDRSTHAQQTYYFHSLLLKDLHSDSGYTFPPLYK